MPKQKDRVIIDTNLWISFLLTRDFSKFDSIIADNEITLLFSEELVNEIIEVTQRIKFRKYFKLDEVESLMLVIKTRAIFVDVTSVIIKCRDPKDNFLLSLSRDGNATHLLTGDKDLLILKRFGQTKIIKITDYLGEE
jgi:uncharacterized protein